jgi:hypothetical protein
MRTEEAPLRYRELYCPAHFGNTYEVMGDAEAEEFLADARWWGYNAYGDWFDTADLKHPAHGRRGEWLLPQALMERKLATFAIADRLGFRTDLGLTPNHVWLDQLRPDLLADCGSDPQHIFGQLLCPSKPEARAVILENHEFLFRSLKETGVTLSSMSAAPYDYGGCACAACAPWIVTFGRLCRDIHALGRRYFPALGARLIGWWWSAEEHRLFKEWADSEAPELFQSLAQHILYNQTSPAAGLTLPRGCEAHAFVHIGYPDRHESPGDIYGAWGPVVSATRLPVTVDRLRQTGASGFVAYSEGAFDDVNKAILAGLSSGRFATGAEVLEAYAERHFAAEGSARREWADWLAGWSTPFAVDARAARAGFDALARHAPRGWRLAQWEQKLRLFESHAAVTARAEWDAERRAAAARFDRELERLYREVWGCGQVRHVLHPRFRRPAWYGEWHALTAARGKSAAGQASQDA